MPIKIIKVSIPVCDICSIKSIGLYVYNYDLIEPYPFLTRS